MEEDGYRKVIPVEKVTEAICNLSDAQWIKLKKIANVYCWAKGMTPDDLLQEAICRALEGTRTCPVEMDIIPFLAGVMKSLASDANRSWWGEKIATVGGHESDSHVSGNPTEQSDDQAIDDRHVDGVHVEQTLREVESLFNNDEQGGFVLMARAAGDSPQEIQEALDISQTEYASILRRVRRRISAHFTDGWQS